MDGRTEEQISEDRINIKVSGLRTWAEESVRNFEKETTVRQRITKRVENQKPSKEIPSKWTE